MDRQLQHLGILLGKSRVTSVFPGQMQPSRKLSEGYVTPLPVPAPGDMQISAQGSCTSSGYSAMMEKLKVLLGMLDAHKPDLKCKSELVICCYAGAYALVLPGSTCL